MKSLARPADKEEILRRLLVVRPESARRWGRMSAHQMVCHLADAYRMATREKDVSGMPSLLERTVVKWYALYLPLPWPAGIDTRPEIDQECGGTSPLDFAVDVACVQALVERLTASTAGLEWPSHPIFGRLSARAWLRWGYLHADHHLRQFGA
jgi:hypothetical protein